MNDDALRSAWLSMQDTGMEPIVATVDAVLREDHEARVNERWVRIAFLVVLMLLCPATIWFAAHGVSPLIRGAYALMAAGLAIAVFAEWTYLAWSHQAQPGAATTTAQLQTTAMVLSRHAQLVRFAPLWNLPIFLGAALVAWWVYLERSHVAGATVGATTFVAWLALIAIATAKGREIDARRSRIDQLRDELIAYSAEP
jgi:hypothetical protein